MEEEGGKMDSHLSSAVAFVEGGIQDACDDSCSICLEAFCESDPSTVTTCKHEFHLQCILEWCQRSSQCPMCWQPISLKDPGSQELLEAVEHERRIRSNQTRTATIFHHPTFGEFELQHLPVGMNEAEIEERIIQHLAAAAAMGRAHHIGRREGLRSRSGAQGRPQFLVFSTQPNAPSVGSAAASSNQTSENELAPAFIDANSSGSHTSVGEPPHQSPNLSPTQADQVTFFPPGSGLSMPTSADAPINRGSPGQSTPVNQDRAGASDFQSFSESLKSRLNAASMRYKESITRSTRGWKEKLLSCNSSVADLGSEVRREVNAGIATVSRMMERLDMRESRRSAAAATAPAAAPPSTNRLSAVDPSAARLVENQPNRIPTESNTSSSCVANSGPN